MNKKSLEFFKSIFENFPHLSILHINNDCDNIKTITQEIANNSNGIFTNIEYSEINEENFRIKSRDYEYTIVSNCLNLIENKKLFLSKIYNTLENSAQLLLLIKKDTVDLYELIELLDELNFLNANNVEIFEEYDLIIAKKMRMWV